MTGDLLHLIHERDITLSKFKKTKDHSWYTKYIYLRNQVQYKKKSAKSDFIASKVDDYKNEPKKLWQRVSVRHRKVKLSLEV